DHPSRISMANAIAHAGLDSRCRNYCRRSSGLARQPDGARRQSSRRMMGTDGDASSVAASLREARSRAMLLSRSRAAHRAAATGFVFAALMTLAADWKIAEPGWRYEFPRDHDAHREFK